jgi:hypothetical protein
MSLGLLLLRVERDGWRNHAHRQGLVQHHLRA